MRRIAMLNQKGGVGKTTTCVNLAAALAQMGQSVLLIDLDPQAHLTLHLGQDPRSTPSIYDVLIGSSRMSEVLRSVGDHLSAVGSHIDLAAAEVELASTPGRELRLRDALADLNADAEFLIIDCPPALGLLTLNALAAAEEVFIPLQPHFLALQGFGRLLETVALVHRRVNPALSVTGIMLCMYEQGTRLAAEVTEELHDFLQAARGQDRPWSNARVFAARVRRNIKLAECPSHGLTILDYAGHSHGAQDYRALADEVLSMSAATESLAGDGPELAPLQLSAGQPAIGP